MNLGQMRTKTQQHLDDDSGSFWADSEIDSYINTAYDYYHCIAVDENYAGLITTGLLSIVASTETVALPSDFFKAKMLERVFATENIALDFVDRIGGAVTTSSSSAAYYLPNWKIEGANIVLEPTPQSSYSNGLRLHYWPVITEMSSDSDEPATGFRAPWHRMIPLRAAMFARGGREENDVSDLEKLLAPMEVNFMNNLESITASRKMVVPFMTTADNI